MQIMIRTQIYISQDTHKKLLYLAEINEEPMAAIVRKFVKEGLKKETFRDFSGKETLRAISNLSLPGGPKDLSKNINHYLYGARKKK